MNLHSAVLEALQEPGGAKPGSYSVRTRVHGCFVGRSSAGSAALIVPIDSVGQSVGRAFVGLSLNFHAELRVEWEGEVRNSAAAVLECENEDLLRTFSLLVVDVAGRMAEGSAQPVRRLLDVVGEWERLLRSRRTFDEGEELGLWGELSFILSRPNVDLAIRSWRSGERESIDFIAGGVGVECKTARTKLQHFASQTQVEPRSEMPVYLVSMAAVIDPSSGLSVAELVEQIDRRVEDALVWERALLERGVGSERVVAVGRKFRLTDGPFWFEHADVPRVRTADAGVSQLRYLVHLDVEKALPEPRVREVLRIFDSLSPPTRPPLR